MKALLPLTMLGAAIYLLTRKSKKKNPSRYERKARTPWNSLNDGEDPTI